MIVTLTAHPALDRTVRLDAPLQVGEVQSARSGREDAAGKGVNVARAVHAADHPVVAVLPLDPEDPYGAALRATHLPVDPVGIRGFVRANLTIVDAVGTTTKINLPGAPLTEADLAHLIEATVAASADADWLVLAGSLPPGAPDDFYARVIHAVRASGGAHAPRIAVDTSGPALHAVVQDGRPDLIKPNEDELAQLAGVELDADTADAAALVDAVHAIARRLVPERVAAAFVTLGALGAVLVDEHGAWFGAAPRISVRSTVGAGDSSLAGFLLASVRGADPAECVRTGIRYGAAAAALPGTQPPSPEDLPAGDVPVRELD